MALKTKRSESRARYFTRQIAADKGWNLSHPQNNGDLLEEQEVADFLPGTALGAKKPDFLLCLNGEPAIVIETKNSYRKINEAVSQAISYCDKINQNGRYKVKIAIGVAGDESTGCIVTVMYLKDGEWSYLKSKGNPLTAILSKTECAVALASNNSTTDVSIPSQSEFIDAAIEVSNILRTAKIETSLRPKVIGTFAVALYKGDVNPDSTDILSDINRMASEAINESRHFASDKKGKLIEAITLGNNDFARLNPFALRIVSILKRLNVRAVLQSDADFLGMFYEAFLRYGTDNNAMGIVFTPRHITKLCVDLIGVEIGDHIIDITCGTGGFLVSAFDSLRKNATSEEATDLVRESIYGYDTNPTVWALACLNMFFRGDGKSNIENSSSLDKESKAAIKRKFRRAFLNPPFHQENEPEREFINTSMDSLIQGGLFAGVIYSGVFADEENKLWRKDFLNKHTLLGMISLPDELFYPNASAITTIMIAKAGVAHGQSKVFVGRIANDGYMKLKGKRVACGGNQIPHVLENFHKFLNGMEFSSDICTVLDAKDIMEGDEFSPQQYLPSLPLTETLVKTHNNETLLSLFQGVTSYPDVTSSLSQVNTGDENAETLPLDETGPLSKYFDIKTGKSAGFKGYAQGPLPYVSSGDGTNGIVGLVSAPDDEICQGCITVSAFGTAYLQPWRYVARGNGGSSVRVLVPKYKMTVMELFWFVAQINSQKWRFNYARQAIKSRLTTLIVKTPGVHLTHDVDVVAKISDFKSKLSELSVLE